MELMNIVVTVAIGVAIGVGMIVIYAWYLYRNLKNRVDQMIAEVLAEAEADLVGLDIEVDQGRYFCYNSKDKQFVCQGNTVAEIKQAFQSRHPGKTAYLAGGDPEVVATIKTELLKLGINENSSSQ
jgi:hypothetical protein